MGSYPEFGLSIVAFFLIIGPLVFIHELGHFVAARMNHIPVEEFGLGLPPRMLILFESGGTKFTLNWLPIGGFMRPAGEDDPMIAGGLAGASKFARLAVLAAGPVANIVLAYVIFVLMFLIGAPEIQPGARINHVEDGSPAALAGLQKGDIVVTAGSSRITQLDDLTTYIHSHLGKTINLEVNRDGKTVRVELIPRTDWPANQGPTGIVIEQPMIVKQYGLFDSSGKALLEIGRVFQLFASFPDLVRQVMDGALPARYVRPGSVIAISQMGGMALDNSIQRNAIWPLLNLAASVSIALGITNLLPFPALDGGRILFVLIEGIRGKRIQPQHEALIHYVGILVLMAAMVVLMYFDITDPLIPR
jgi:regulator of sigma E protease